MLLAAAVFAATVGPAQALTARTLSLSVAGSVGAGVGASFSGTLLKTPTVGSTVYLQRKSGSSWVRVATTATTTTGGAYKGTFTTPAAVGAYTFRAYSSATSRLAAAVSASRIMRVRVTFNSSTLNPSTSAILSGRVYPWKSTFTRPVLQRRMGTTGSFVALATLTPNSTSGNFTRSLTGLAAGQTTQYRVVLATSGGYSGATSGTLTLRAGNPVLKTFVADGLADVPYTSSVGAVDGRPGVWALSAGALPVGLSLNATNGAIAGTPTAEGSSIFTIGFTDAASRPASREYTMQIDPATNPNTPTTTGLSASNAWTCRVRANATFDLECWGSDLSGRLGVRGFSASPNNPNRPAPALVGRGWAQVSTGTFLHTCGVKNDYSLWCWGDGGDGRLGNGREVIYDTPQQVQAGTHWRQVTAGFGHSCGIRTNDSLWCWGDGQPSGSLPGQLAPGTTWKQVSAHYSFTCGIRTDATFAGTLWCWGQGVGPTQEDSHATNWASVSGNCGVRTDQTLWCWTYNSSSQMVPPTQIGTAEWASASGHNSPCAVKSDGQLWCWGSGRSGQLGNGANTDSNVPVRVGTDTDWASVTTGDGHACAAKTTGATYCWGDNSAGQLGINRSTPSFNTPQLVNDD